MVELSSKEIIILFRKYGKEPRFPVFLTEILPKLLGKEKWN
jgi:hypothetical protein